MHIKENIETRVYENTQELLKKTNDKEIVVDNPNKIFNMIENFGLLDDVTYFPVNDDFSTVPVYFHKL